MRRPLNIVLGLLEILVALVLGAFVLQLPGSADVMDKVGRVEAVGRQSSEQVAELRKQLDLVHKRQPRARQLAKDLSGRVNSLKDQQAPSGVASDRVADMLAKTANNIDNATTNLDGSRLDQFAAGLAAAADLLDNRLAQMATRTEAVSKSPLAGYATTPAASTACGTRRRWTFNWLARRRKC